MAAGTILTVLTNIPWGTVIENAPKVADGASKLWSSVTRKNKPPPAQQHGQVDANAQGSMSDAELLLARLQVVEESVNDLNVQMQASSALIKELAEQNAILIGRIELNRIRLARTFALACGIGTLLLGLIAYVFIYR
jgi:hypothetical protein